MAAEEKVREITAVPEVDKEYTGEVVRIAPFGAFVKILPNCDGMVHISQMGNGYVRQVEDILTVGDTVQVRVLSIDDQNRVDLTLCGESAEKANEISANTPPREDAPSRDNSGPRRNYRDGGNRRRERSGGRSGGNNRNRDEGQSRSNSLRVPKDRF